MKLVLSVCAVKFGPYAPVSGHRTLVSSPNVVLSGLVRLSGGAGLCSITLTCLSSSSLLSCELSPRDSVWHGHDSVAGGERASLPLWWNVGLSGYIRSMVGPHVRGEVALDHWGEQLCCACPHLPAAELPSFCPVLALYPHP